MASLISKKKGRHSYYYIVESARVHGKPRIVRQVYLGTPDNLLSKLQAKYQQPLEVDSLDFGAVSALWAQAKELELVKLIDDVIPQRRGRKISVGMFLTVGAINRVVEPKSKDGIGQWMKGTVLPRLIGNKAQAFDSASFWDAMNLVKEQDIATIEEKIWGKVLQLYQVFTDVVFYDTTNFATHIDALTPCKIPQKGKPKQGGKEQRLVGLALAATRVLGLPFLHKVYEGNCHDAKLFPGAMSLLIERYSKLSKQVRDLTLVFDKGNNSDKNIRALDACGIENGVKVFCIGSLKPSYYPELVSIPLDKFSGDVGGYKVYRTVKLVFEQRRTVVVTFHQGLYNRQLSTLNARIERVKDEIAHRFSGEESKQRYRHSKQALLKAYQKVIEDNRLKNLLKIKIHGSRAYRLSIEIDKKAFKNKEKGFGKTILFSDHNDWTSKQIMDAYHEKNVIEEDFKFLKDRDYLHFDPLYHWTDQKIRVHGLMCVLGLLLAKLLLYRAKKAELDMSLSVLLEELNDIKEIILIYPGNYITKKIKRLSTIQEKLFKLFELGTYEESP